TELPLCLYSGPVMAATDTGVSLTMLDLFKDLWGFASERKKFWLVPLIGTLLILSVLVAIAEFSTVAPFIYTLF
ncbi:MAG: DUF5989 family protein, partial [Candidatus Binataceae bacterium]